MNYRYLIPILCITFLPLMSCGTKPSPVTNDSDRNDKAMLTYAWEKALQPSLEKLVKTAQELDRKVSDLCPGDATQIGASPDETKFNALKSAWEEAFKALKKQEIFYFGPYENQSYYTNQGIMRLKLDDSTTDGSRAGAKIPELLANPKASEAIESLVAAGKENKNATVSTTCGDACKGIPALEYLIYDTEVRKKDQYCHLLRKVSEIYVEDTKTLQTLWYNDNKQAKELTDEGIANLGEPSKNGYARELIDYFLKGKGYYYWMLYPPSDPRQELGDYTKGLNVFVNGLQHLLTMASGNSRLNSETAGKAEQYPHAHKGLDGVLYNMLALRELVVAGGSKDNWEEGTICYYVDRNIDKVSGRNDAVMIKFLIDKIVNQLEENSKNSCNLSCSENLFVISDMKKLIVLLKSVLTAWGIQVTKADADGD